MIKEFKDLSRAVRNAIYRQGIKDIDELETWLNSGKHLRDVGPERLKEIEELLGKKIEYNGGVARKNNYVIQLTIETSEHTSNYARCRWSIMPPGENQKKKGVIFGIDIFKKINKSLDDILHLLLKNTDTHVSWARIDGITFEMDGLREYWPGEQERTR